MLRYQRLAAFNQRLGVTQHMRFTDLVLHAYLVSDRLEAIGIIGNQHSRSHTLGDRLNPLFERLAISPAHPPNPHPPPPPPPPPHPPPPPPPPPSPPPPPPPPTP